MSALPMSDDEVAARVHRVEILISNLLRLGVIVSLSLICIGTTISFMHHPEYVTSSSALSHLTEPSTAVPHTQRDIISGLRQGRGQAIVMLGLIVLIATPVMRVAISVLAFIYQRDRIYTLITLIVFGLLMLSFVLGKVE